jgi:hypothetical protein
VLPHGGKRMRCRLIEECRRRHAHTDPQEMIRIAVFIDSYYWLLKEKKIKPGGILKEAETIAARNYPGYIKKRSGSSI